jgi:3-deoxy-D-manno-octulosonate 8-phosphate phosphatase (KDO 8-P phosphatase)
MDVIKNVGFSACPADAVEVVKKNVNLILNTKGGDGCVRELVEKYFL